MSFWFPPNQNFDASPLINVQRISNFDQLPEFYPGDQHRTQLSPGKFTGTLLNAGLGALEYTIEQNNQDTELETCTSKDLFSFSFVIQQERPFVAYGVQRDMGTVLISPPKAAVHTICPADGSLGVVFVNAQRLLCHEALVPEAVDWLLTLENQGALVQSPWLAKRLQMDTRQVLECARTAGTPQIKATLDESACLALASALSFDFLSRKYDNILKQITSFDAFWELRQTMLNELSDTLPNTAALVRHRSSSKRSIEKMFSRNVGLAPIRYFQVLRLNRTRQKLLDQTRLAQSIGDIAAEEGFWDWSRFAKYYFRQFGERPSETRKMIDG